MTTDQTAAEELRDLTREAHGLLKDLRNERKAIEQLLGGIPAKVDGRIKEALTKGLAELGEVTQKAMAASVAKVGREFDRLEAVFTGTDPASRRAGKPPLEELLHQHREVRGG